MILFLMFTPPLIVITTVILILYLPEKQSEDIFFRLFCKNKIPVQKDLPIQRDLSTPKGLPIQNDLPTQESIPLQEKGGKAVPISKEAENIILFEALNHSVLSNKLYLDPKIERGDLCRIIGVEKNRFAQIISQNTGTHLNGYMNNLRLDYAVQLIKERPECIFKTISMECGLTNIRTFYRLFHDRFGMTPMEYRKSLQKRSSM